MKRRTSAQLHQSSYPVENKQKNGCAAQSCCTSLLHIDASESDLSHGNRLSISDCECYTSLLHKPVTHRRKRRVTGVFLRGAVWQFRQRVPVDLAEVMGRSVVGKSLQTSSYRDAIRLARIAAYEFSLKFDRIRYPQTAEAEFGSATAQSDVVFKADAPVTRLKLSRVKFGTDEKPKANLSSLINSERQPDPHRISLKGIYQRYLEDPAVIRSPKTLLAYRSV